MAVQQVLLGGFIGVNVLDHGTPVGTFTTLDFQGAGVLVTPAGSTCIINVPGGGGGGVTAQDALGNVVPGASTLTFNVGGASPAFTVSPGAPGEALIDLNLSLPLTPAEDGRAAYADGGDLAYSGGLNLDGIPTFSTPTYPFIFANVVGYAVIQFDPPVAPPGPPFFGTGNGMLHVSQHAAPGSGVSGGDNGIQAGNSDTGALGGTAFVQAGASVVAADNGFAELRNAAGAARVQVGGAADGVGFHGSSPIAKPTIVGSRGGNAALASLLTQLAAYGLIIDGTVP